MAYLIDASSLIEAQNRYFPFDICPGFWDWLEHQNKLGIVYSIDRVYQELVDRGDDLAIWARERNDAFFLPTDNTITTSMTNVSSWLMNVSQAGIPFTRAAVTKFLGDADPFLVAHALAGQHIVVTEEVGNQIGQIKEVKIPTVCQHFKIRAINIHDALRETGAKLILSEME